MAVIECPRCQARYELPVERLGETVQCRQVGCRQSFTALAEIDGAEPLAARRETVAAIQGAVPSARITADVIEQGARRSLGEFGAWLLWLGVLLISAAAVQPTSVASAGVERIHNLDRAARQLTLVVTGVALLIGGAACRAGSGRGIAAGERWLLAAWVLLLWSVVGLPCWRPNPASTSSTLPRGGAQHNMRAWT